MASTAKASSTPATLRTAVMARISFLNRGQFNGNRNENSGICVAMSRYIHTKNQTPFKCIAKTSTVSLHILMQLMILITFYASYRFYNLIYFYEPIN